MLKIKKTVWVLILAVLIIAAACAVLIKTAKKGYTPNEFEKEVISALIYDGTSSYFSTENSVGSANPQGYVFLQNGRFSYSRGQYAPSENDRVLSYRGEWKVENSKLKLYISEEKTAVGGFASYDEIEGAVLKGYTIAVTAVNKTVEYTLKECRFDELGRVTIIFEDTDVTLTKLSCADDGYVSDMANAAEVGY